MAFNDVLAALTVRLTTDATKFTSGVDKAMGKMNAMEAGAKKLGGVLAGFLSVGAVGNWIVESVKMYDVQAKAESSLLTALKGRFDIQERLSDQASELQSRTLFGDEETIAAASRLAQILGTNEDAIRRLLPLVQDLATAQNMDLASAAGLVAKSVGSSTNALSRYGIHIEGSVGSAERLESAVRALNEQVGGQAEAAAESGIGSITQLTNAWSDYREEVGRALSPENSGFVKWIKSVVEADAANVKLRNDIKEMGREMGEQLPLFDLIALGWGKITKRAQEWHDRYEKFKEKKLADLLEKENEEIVVQIPLLEQIENKLKAAKEARDESITEAQLARHNREIQLLEEELKRLRAIGTIPKAPELPKGPGLQKFDIEVEDVDWDEMIDEDAWRRDFGEMQELADKFADEFEQSAQRIKAIADTIKDGIANVAMSWAESLGQMMAGAEDFNITKAILDPIADMLASLGKALVTTGFGVLAFRMSLQSLNPGVAIGAGLALIALAAAMKTTIANIPDAATSGSVTTQGSVATGNSSLAYERYYGERTVYFEGRLSGNNIVLLEDRNRQRRNSIT